MSKFQMCFVLFLGLVFKIQNNPGAPEEDQIKILKNQISSAFNVKNYKKASVLLTKLIKQDKENYENYFRRATASFGMGKIPRAIVDLKTVVQKNSTYQPGFEYLAKYQSFICDFDNATTSYKKAWESVDKEKKEEYRKAINEMDAVRRTLKNIETISCSSFNNIKRLFEVCRFYPKVLDKMAECLIKRNDQKELAKIASKHIKIDQNHMKSYFDLSNAYFLQGKPVMALMVAKKGLNFDPEYEPLLKLHKTLSRITSLEAQIKSNRAQNSLGPAISLSIELLSLLPPKSFASESAHLDLCELYNLEKEYEKAVEACSQALEFNEQSKRGLSARAKAHIGLRDFEKAAFDYRNAQKHHPDDPEITRNLHEATQKAKQAAMKDYYAILDVRRNADGDEIKKAYRKQALTWHPDRWRKKEEKEKAQEKFKDINEANEVLSNGSLRQRYDAGEDVYKDKENRNPYGGGFHHGGGGFPFQFRDASGRTFFMQF